MHPHCTRGCGAAGGVPPLRADSDRRRGTLGVRTQRYSLPVKISSRPRPDFKLRCFDFRFASFKLSRSRGAPLRANKQPKRLNGVLLLQMTAIAHDCNPTNFHPILATNHMNHNSWNISGDLWTFFQLLDDP